MPRVSPPGPLPSNSLTDALAKGLRDFTGPENPPVNLPLKAASEAASYMTGPENPPVNFLAQLLRRGDPHGLMTMGNPIGMALKKYDMYGKAIPVAAETGKPLAKTARDYARESAGHEAATVAARKTEAATGGPLKSVGFRNNKTGEVIEGGHFHPSSYERLPDEWKKQAFDGTIEHGFITKEGKFLNRKEASDLTGISFSTRPGFEALESYDGAAKGIYGPKITAGGFGPNGERISGDLRAILDEANQRDWEESLVNRTKPMGAEAVLQDVLEKLRKGYWKK